MKKITVFLLLIWVGLVVLNAQTVLRENIAIVKPSYTKSSVTFIRNMSKVIRKDGYGEAADILDSYTKGGFGSGFIYTNSKNQKSYIVTNRHVVAQANQATIEFQHSNDQSTEFKDCNIIAVDELLDLALIELPADVKISKGLEIATSLPEEGSTVYSAGFPGLNNKPSWQLGNGIISNVSVQDKILSGTNTTSAIQHTAQIDAGSSGGPLLIKVDDNYKIIGVNTWKIAERENTNFSISLQTLSQFLNEHIDMRERNTTQDLEKNAKKFAVAMKKDYMAVLPFISSEYIANVSVDNFYEVINATPDSITDKIAMYFGNGHPIDGVRIGLAYIMFEKIAAMNLEYNSLNNIENGVGNVLFTSDKKEFTTEWGFEQGEWKLQKLPALKLTDLEDQGVSTRFGYKNSFKIGMEIPLSEKGRWGTLYNATYEHTYVTFITSGFTLGTGELTYNPKEGWADDTGTFETKKYFYGGITLGGQLPVKLSSLYFIPNLKGFIEIGTNDVPGALGYIAGIEMAYKLSRKTYLLGGLSYKHRSFNTTDSHIYKDYSTFGIHLGITW
jgi:serine protease Do